MLLKLIKYDFKATYLKMLSTFALYFVLSVVVPFIIFPFNKDASTIYVSLVTFMGSFAFAAVTTIFIFQHFNSNIFGNEGYLMSTLPTNGYMLVLSKFIVAFIWNLIAFIVVAISFFSLMTLYYWHIPEFAKAFVAFSGDARSWEVIGQCLQMVAAIMLGSTVTYMTIYLAIAISKLPLWHKFGTLMGVISFFVLTTIENIPSSFMQTTTTYPVNVDPRTFNMLFRIFEENNFPAMMWYYSLIDLAFAVVFFFACGWLINKKISLK